MYSNYLPYYVLWLQQQRRQQEEKEQKEAEKKAEEEKVQQQLQQEFQEQQKSEESEKTEEKVEDKQETIVEESKPEPTPETTETKEEKPTTIESTTDKKQETSKNETITIVPKPTDCELLYAIGSEEYLLCDYNRKTNQQNNMLIAVMFLACIAIAVGICAIIVRHIDKKVEEDFKNNKGGYCLG